MKDFEKNSFPMKSIPQAMELRNLILENFEKALLTAVIKDREGLMNIVVVGGGPTGVETAGALGELKIHVLPHDYPELDFHRMQIHLVDMEDRLLKTMSVEASNSAERFLKRFDINLWLKTKVQSYDGKILRLSNGKEIRSDTVIWAAGVKGAAIPGLEADAILPNGRVRVDVYNRVAGYQNIFALGDVAAMVTDKFPQGHPMLAPVAVAQAKQLAKNLRRLLSNVPLKSYVYKNIGTMATIGRNHAVVDLNFMKFQGILAWFFWLFVHLMALVGFRNKVVAFVNWAWNYFSYDRGLRFILRPSERDQ
jgi:NADH dehydrogenase